MNKILALLVAAVLCGALSLGDAWGRGFGGGGRGGFGGGGFGGAGFGGGGFRSGGFDSGGWSGGGFRDRGFSGGGGEGFRDRGFEGSRDSYGGGMRDQGYRPEAQRSYSGDNWRDRGGYDAARMQDGAGISRTQLDKFLGMPTDAGIAHVAPGPAREGLEGGRVTAGRVEGARGAGVEASRVTARRVEGPLGGSAAFISGTHVGYVPPNVRSAQAWSVRNSFDRHDFFNQGWFTNHPKAWIAAGIAASAWNRANWYDAAAWLGCEAIPDDYDYGSTVLYQGDTVYVEGQPAGSPAQYYDQASSLATSGSSDQGDQSQWMPLGVFGMVQGSQTDPTMVFQLAVNKQGIVRGNFIDPITQTTLPVQGAVDKKTQRVAWTVGDNKTTVFDTGLYNLTKDEAPALVHFGKDKTQEWLMVRMDKQAQAQQQGS